MSPQEFVIKYIDEARQSEMNTGVPALVQLAQAAIESGWGKHAPGNNFHGIKRGNKPIEKCQLLTTTEYFKTPDKGSLFPEVISISWIEEKKRFKYKVKDWFRKYDRPAECFIDHAKILQLPRYKKAFDTSNPYDFIIEIGKGGYSTSPTYATYVMKVMKMIEKICGEEL